MDPDDEVDGPDDNGGLPAAGGGGGGAGGGDDDLGVEGDEELDVQQEPLGVYSHKSDWGLVKENASPHCLSIIQKEIDKYNEDPRTRGFDPDWCFYCEWKKVDGVERHAWVKMDTWLHQFGTRQFVQVIKNVQIYYNLNFREDFDDEKPWMLKSIRDHILTHGATPDEVWEGEYKRNLWRYTARTVDVCEQVNTTTGHITLDKGELNTFIRLGKDLINKRTLKKK